MKIEKICVLVSGSSQKKSIENMLVLMRWDGKVLYMPVMDLLHLVPGEEAATLCGEYNIKMISLDRVEISYRGEAAVEGTEMHSFREDVRNLLKKEGFIEELEMLNRKLAVKEFECYMQEFGEWDGFSHYFFERFPVASQQKYGYNIGDMFFHYRNEFDRDYVPKRNVVYYRNEWRTGDRGFGDYYHYPIRIPYYRQEVSYKTKAMVCTIQELELKRYCA